MLHKLLHSNVKLNLPVSKKSLTNKLFHYFFFILVKQFNLSKKKLEIIINNVIKIPCNSIKLQLFLEKNSQINSLFCAHRHCDI